MVTTREQVRFKLDWGLACQVRYAYFVDQFRASIISEVLDVANTTVIQIIQGISYKGEPLPGNVTALPVVDSIEEIRAELILECIKWVRDNRSEYNYLANRLKALRQLRSRKRTVGTRELKIRQIKRKEYVPEYDVKRAMRVTEDDYNYLLNKAEQVNFRPPVIAALALYISGYSFSGAANVVGISKGSFTWYMSKMQKEINERLYTCVQ